MYKTMDASSDIKKTARKTARTARSADDYDIYTEIEHILKVSDTMVGDVRPSSKPRRVYSEGRVSVKEILSCDGFERLFIEAVSNAFDNIIATRHLAPQTPSRIALLSSRSPPVTVTVTPTTVTIYNIGEPIPVVPHATSTPENLAIVPWLVFGNLRASSNYDESVSRIGAGRNGLGAKLINIFSKRFSVKVGDPVNGQEYHGIWSDNMGKLELNSVKPGYSYSVQEGKWVSNVDPEARRGAKKGYSGPAYVEVSYDVDFSRFAPIQENTADIIGSFARIALDYSFSSKTTVRFNDEVLDVRTPRSFAKVYFPEGVVENRMVVHYEWASKQDADAAASVGGGKDAVSKALASGALSSFPTVELIVLDTPDDAQDFGFVNGICVPRGVHMGIAASRVFAAIVAASPAAAAASKGGLASLKPSDVRPHVSLIVNCHLEDPRFASQTKQELTEPEPNITIKADAFKAAMTSTSETTKWQVGARLAEVAETKIKRVVAKTDGKKSKRVEVEGHVDANKAGGSESQECTVFITEGLSAEIYALALIDHLRGKRDLYGVYGVRGKFINATAATTSALMTYKEYVNLKTVVGLVEGANYEDAAAVKTLRYGHIVILADADEDGSSIRALLVNCFAERWPSLLKTRRVSYMATPAIRITHPKTNITFERFFSDRAYNEWVKTPPGAAAIKGMNVRHVKGLSTSNNSDVKDDVTTSPVVAIICDPRSSESLSLAFSPKRANDRKQWISEWQRSGALIEGDADLEAISKAAVAAEAPPAAGTSTKTKRGTGASRCKKGDSKEAHSLIRAERTITALINKDLAEYSFGSLRRAIPSFRDGLKHSQRQALWCALRTWGYGVGAAAQAKSMKVSRFAAAVAEAASYAHGEASMQGCVVSLAQGFAGTNNIPLLLPDGQFGSLAGGPGVYGAPRYIYTKLNWSAKYLFSKQAVELIPREFVEGELAESEWLPCDISMAVVNGARGIATGWSTSIPSHHPIETVDWYLGRIAGRAPLKAPSPWFSGSRADNQIENGEDGKRTLVSKGIIRIMREPSPEMPTYDIVIEELPIGKWINNYAAYLTNLVKIGKLGDFRDDSKTHTARFELYKLSTYEEVASSTTQTAKASKTAPTKTAPTKTASRKTVAEATTLPFPPPPLTLDKLDLVKRIPLNNYYLLDETGTPKRYETVGGILEDHYRVMSEVYERQKAATVASLREDLAKQQARYALVDAIVSERIIVFKRPEREILAEITRVLSEASASEFATLKMKDATADELDRLRSKIESLQKELEEVLATPHLVFWQRRLVEFRAELAKRIVNNTLAGDLKLDDVD